MARGTKRPAASSSTLFRALLFTAICADCQNPFNQRNARWFPEGKVIQRHWSSGDCHSDKQRPMGKKCSVELRARQIALHDRAKQKPDDRRILIDAEFGANPPSKGNVHYCSNCGFCAQRKRDLQKHFQNTRNPYACKSESHQKQGRVLTSLYKVTVPQEHVDAVLNGTFVLPYARAQSNSRPPPPSPSPAPTPAPLLPASTVTVPTARAGLFDFEAPRSMLCNDAASPATVTAALERTFTDSTQSTEEQKHTLDVAQHYRAVFIPLVDEMKDTGLFDTSMRGLYADIHNAFDPAIDNIHMRTLLAAGRTWLMEGIANDDVQRRCAGHRARLYQVGHQVWCTVHVSFRIVSYSVVSYRIVLYRIVSYHTL